MSIKAMTFVWEHSTAQGTDLLCLLALADYANDEGEAYPGIKRLAQKCRVGERAIQKVIAKLKEAGEIDVEYCEGLKTSTGHTNRYTLKKYQEGMNARTPLPLRDEPQDTPGVNVGTPKPSVVPSVTTTTTLPVSQGEAQAPPPPAPPPSEKEEFHKLKARWIARQSGKNVNHAQAGTGLNQLVKAGCTPDEFDALDDWLRTQSWVEPGATLYPQTYFKKLDQFRYVRERGGSSPQNNSYANHRMSKAEMSMAAVDRVFARLELEGGIYHAG
jgi:hypothetical protein